uniref:Putative ovule protein n=2 Tax=Solanum chacoense TaxID=4108 RepID=A0A0V0HAV9_SOLCH
MSQSSITYLPSTLIRNIHTLLSKVSYTFEFKLQASKGKLENSILLIPCKLSKGSSYYPIQARLQNYKSNSIKSNQQFLEQIQHK